MVKIGTSDFEIINKQTVGENIKRIEVYAPDIARNAMPGQFTIVMADRFSRRIPISISDMLPHKGIITIVFEEQDESTQRLSNLKIGDSIFSILGPLGEPAVVDCYGTVLCIGYAIGIAQILPICRVLKRYDNKVVAILGAERKNRLLLENQMRLSCDKIFITTDDGSYSQRGSVTDAVRELLSKQGVDCIYAAAPIADLDEICRISRLKSIPTIVGLQSAIVDGTGICRSCRLKLGDEDVLSCIHGPFFDGHKVDFCDLISRVETDKNKIKWNDRKRRNLLRRRPKIFLKPL